MVNPKILLVCGGRHFSAHSKLFATLDHLKPSLVITGTYELHTTPLHRITGADELALTWCRMNGIQSAMCEANWDFFNRAAGPIRNRNMLMLNPTAVLVFPGGTGTANMKKVALATGIHVMEMTDTLLPEEMNWL